MKLFEYDYTLDWCDDTMGWRVRGMNDSASNVKSFGEAMHDIVDHLMLKRLIGADYPEDEYSQECIATASLLWGSGTFRSTLLISKFLVRLYGDISCDMKRPVDAIGPLSCLTGLSEISRYIMGFDKNLAEHSMAWFDFGLSKVEKLYPLLSHTPYRMLSLDEYAGDSITMTVSNDPRRRIKIRRV